MSPLRWFMGTFFRKNISCSVVFSCLPLHGLQPARLLFPWNFPAKNTGVGCCSQGSNPGLPHFRQILYHLNHPESPNVLKMTMWLPTWTMKLRATPWAIQWLGFVRETSWNRASIPTLDGYSRSSTWRRKNFLSGLSHCYFGFMLLTVEFNPSWYNHYPTRTVAEKYISRIHHINPLL